ncbi:MAG: hypothetical protein Q4P66_06200 [Actinomycetaceae bacterium]|nr:hypothetical protein [Actinomycetaceae bacterium]
MVIHDALGSRATRKRIAKARRTIVEAIETVANDILNTRTPPLNHDVSQDNIRDHTIDIPAGSAAKRMAKRGVTRDLSICSSDGKNSVDTTQQSGVWDQDILAQDSVRFLYGIVFMLHLPHKSTIVTKIVHTYHNADPRGNQIFNALVQQMKNDASWASDSHHFCCEEQKNRCDFTAPPLPTSTPHSLFNGHHVSNKTLIMLVEQLHDLCASLSLEELGSVYEGLIGYSGFIANEPLYEVAKEAGTTSVSWVVTKEIADGLDKRHLLDKQVLPAGQFVFRPSARARKQTGAFYTPQLLAEFIVEQALEVIDTNALKADELLSLKVCEPALGSGACALELVRQLAQAYLQRKQQEMQRQIPANDWHKELRRVKAWIASHQLYGVDVNAHAVTLAKVMLTVDICTTALSTSHTDSGAIAQARAKTTPHQPADKDNGKGIRNFQEQECCQYFARGNALLGARNRVYPRTKVAQQAYLHEQGIRHCVGKTLPDGHVFQFLLPGDGWGAVGYINDPLEKRGVVDTYRSRKDLQRWSRMMKKPLQPSHVKELADLSLKVNQLWKIVSDYQLAHQEYHDTYRNVWPYMDVEGNKQKERRHLNSCSENLTSSSRAVYNQAKRCLKTIMDCWCALWMWPLDAPVSPEGKHIQPPTIDQWIDGLKSLLNDEISQGPYLSQCLNNEADPTHLFRKYPWMGVCANIAEREAFFHWPLEYASVSAQGGFDIVVGNPPWTRPDWDEKAIYSAYDPWWQIESKVTQQQKQERKQCALSSHSHCVYVMQEASELAGLRAFLKSSALYPMTAHIRPDLYRSFLEQAFHHTYRKTDTRPIVAFIHPETHLMDPTASEFRQECYLRLRRHWQFVNEKMLFDTAHGNRYGVHIYGPRQHNVSFMRASSLYHPDTARHSLRMVQSGPNPPATNSTNVVSKGLNMNSKPKLLALNHSADGPSTDSSLGLPVKSDSGAHTYRSMVLNAPSHTSGADVPVNALGPDTSVSLPATHSLTIKPATNASSGTQQDFLPGVKDSDGKWDVRPHAQRIIHVDNAMLNVWSQLFDEPGTQPLHARSVYPINQVSARVLHHLAELPKVGDLGLEFSAGLNETVDRRRGLCEVHPGRPTTWDDVILQGPHISVGNPFAKEPNPSMRSNQDYQSIDLHALDSQFIPRTIYRPHLDKMQTTPRLNTYRLAWRTMASITSVRTFYACVIPPGATHINSIISASGGVFEDGGNLLECLGQWISLPLDFLIKISHLNNLFGSTIERLPTVLHGPARQEIVERTGRLVCLTSVFAPLWESATGQGWTPHTPVRTALQRYRIGVELDVLAALTFGLNKQDLYGLYRTQFPVLQYYDRSSFYDRHGREIPKGLAKNLNKEGEAASTLHDMTWIHPQSGQQYVCEPPFYRRDRMSDINKAYQRFSPLFS